MSIYETSKWLACALLCSTNDGPILIKDVGVLYRRTPDAQDTAYFGAVYINEC
ncbi:hypothetical protein DOY81_011799 [Sarcophaga bullata]|nr:hypothetical protein DOY81_011799 [Sarcophaga bullata]